MARLGNWTLPAADAAEPSECYYQGLLRLDLHRVEPFYPALRLHGAPALRRRSAAAGEGAFSRLSITWIEQRQGVRLTREWRVYPGVDAVTAIAAIQSESAPLLEFHRADYINVVDTLPVDLRGWTADALIFHGRTDYINELVLHERRVIAAGGEPFYLPGNLLFLEPPGGGRGIFMLHEGPPPDEGRPECPGNFRMGPAGVQALGWGIRPEEILPRKPRASYAVTTGGYVGGEFEKLCALRALIKARYPAPPNRATVVANPWGDGQCYKHLGEKFILRELDVCSRMGIQVYQIDDGWQAGGVLRDISIDNLAAPPGYWEIHPVKFPRGFAPLARKAAQAGVQLSLWFAPDVARQYRNWREQRDLLLQFHRRYGINTFKIDAVTLNTRAAEENLQALLRSVIQESGGRVRFNMDVTNGRRLGYFASLRYGDIFIENRYVRPGRARQANTYLPWRVLRNLWRLAHYLPAQRLQFEFPNRHKPFFARPRDVLQAFEMRACRDDYLAAITMMAAPLCWAEPSGIPRAARGEIARTLGWHHNWRRVLPGAEVFPVGAEPDGHAWTGFQAVCPDNPGAGFVLVFREDTPRAFGAIQLLGQPAAARVKCVSHPGSPAELTSAGVLRARIPRPNDFRLYWYES